MNQIKAYAVHTPHGELTRYDYDAGELPADEVQIKVHYCGVCHTDLAMLDNEWGLSQYPVVAGHEIIGEIVKIGSAVKGLMVGQMVGVGYNAQSCQHCDPCIGGRHNLCGQAVPTVMRMGGFADQVRAGWQWAIPLPEKMDYEKSAPLLCGGIAVFASLLEHNIQSYQKVGVIGVGGLGHLALQFFKAWGCEVTAFAYDLSQENEYKNLGADFVVSSKDPQNLPKGKFDLIVSTVGAGLDWDGFLGLLKPNGKLHLLGGTTKSVELQAFSLITGNKSLTASSGGSPLALRQMSEFAARHNITAMVETFPMSQINDAIAYLRAGKAHYRIVLKNDF